MRVQTSLSWSTVVDPSPAKASCGRTGWLRAEQLVAPFASGTSEPARVTRLPGVPEGWKGPRA